MAELGNNIEDEEKELKVINILDANGNWDKSRLRTPIPDHVWQSILDLPRPLQRDLCDKMIWGETGTGSFTCKSAYAALNGDTTLLPINGQRWDWLWKTNCSERMRHFLWLCSHNSLATNSMRFERRIAASNLCQICNLNEETVTHALRDCFWAKEIWEFAIAPTQFLKFTLINPDCWIKENITKVKFDNIILPNIPWDIMFVTIAWSIWKTRNRFIFQNTREPLQLVIRSAKRLAEDLSMINRKGKMPKVKNCRNVKWTKPNEGWHKVNTDGSVLMDKRSASAGGLIRDENGQWITGFTRKLGDVTITTAELLAAREGLSLAWERRLQRIILEIDSEVVVQLIKEAATEDHPLGQIIEDCRLLLRMPWESRIVHTMREGNQCANALAKLDHDIQGDFETWEEPPTFVIPLICSELV